MAYSKLHSSIVNSSLWTESDPVRILFVTLLAVADREGCIYGSRSGLARIANIDPEDVEESFAVLLAPDKNSCDKIRAPENNGRRIEEISGGFRLLNYEYYRGLRNDDDRREQNKLAQKRFRERFNSSASVSQDKPASALISQHQPPKAHADADAEAEKEGKGPNSGIEDLDSMQLGNKVIEELNLSKRTTGLLNAIGVAIDFTLKHEAVKSKAEAVQFVIDRGREQLKAGGSLDRFWFESQKWRKKRKETEHVSNGKAHETPSAVAIVEEIRRKREKAQASK